MEYLNPKEVTASRKEIKERLSKFVGPTVRHKHGIRFFCKYSDRFFGLAGCRRKDVAVLDCGTAGGGFVNDLYQAGFTNICGLDIDDYLPLDKKNLLNDFKTTDLSFDKIPWPDDSFKAVTAWCVLPHLENPHNFVREAYRVLEPGGFFIISLINIISWPNRRYFLKHKEFPSFHARNNHITMFTPAIFKKTVLKYFDLVGTEYFITPRIFHGFRGSVRRYLLNTCAFFSGSLQSKLEARWGAKAVYILKKS